MKKIVTNNHTRPVELDTTYIWVDTHDPNEIIVVIHADCEEFIFNNPETEAIYKQDLFKGNWRSYNFDMNNLGQLFAASTILQDFILFNLNDFINSNFIEQVIDV